MIKGTQDGETLQQKKIQEIFLGVKIMCENCQSHNRSCIMMPPPQTVLSSYVATFGMLGGGGGYNLSSMYVIRKYCMVSVTVRIKENFKKASHVAFCG